VTGSRRHGNGEFIDQLGDSDVLNKTSDHWNSLGRDNIFRM
jgi:hypothetical protein